jgi:biotin synthase
MNEQMQAMCFLAGANSIFYGCKLLTAENPETNQDIELFRKLGINTETVDDNSVMSDKLVKTAIVDQQNSDLFYNASV